MANRYSKVARPWHTYSRSGAVRRGRKDGNNNYPRPERADLGYHREVIDTASAEASVEYDRWLKRDDALLQRLKVALNREASELQRLRQTELELERTPEREPRSKWVYRAFVTVLGLGELAVDYYAIEFSGWNVLGTLCLSLVFSGGYLYLAEELGHLLKSHRRQPHETVGMISCVVLAIFLSVAIGIFRSRMPNAGGFLAGGTALAIWGVGVVLSLAYFDLLNSARQKYHAAKDLVARLQTRRETLRDRCLNQFRSLQDWADRLGQIYEAEVFKWHKTIFVLKHSKIAVPERLLNSFSPEIVAGRESQ